MRNCSMAVAAGLAALTVLALVHSASAGGDLGFRGSSFWVEPVVAEPAPVETEAPRPPAIRHHHARRIWAAAGTRPLTITATRHRAAVRLARAGRRTRLAQARRMGDPQVVFAKLPVLPQPGRPALVSIYADRTLRTGDAVMMADGIHVFRGGGAGPYGPHDFVRLQLVASLDWHLRQSLDVLDKNPPARWTALELPAG